MERDVAEPQPLSAVGGCLRQPGHTPLIILQLNTQPLAACLYVFPVCINDLHKPSKARQMIKMWLEGDLVARVRLLLAM